MWLYILSPFSTSCDVADWIWWRGWVLLVARDATALLSASAVSLARPTWEADPTWEEACARPGLLQLHLCPLRCVCSHASVRFHVLLLALVPKRLKYCHLRPPRPVVRDDAYALGAGAWFVTKYVSKGGLLHVNAPCSAHAVALT